MNKISCLAPALEVQRWFTFDFDWLRWYRRNYAKESFIKLASELGLLNIFNI
jgi:hypothetical protein